MPARHTAITINQIYRCGGMEFVSPFFDDELMRITRRYSTDKRFIRGLKGYCTKPIPKQIPASRGMANIAYQRKGGSEFYDELYAWMDNGSLKDRVHAIERPAFMERFKFNALLANPNDHLLRMLSYDIFLNDIVKPLQRGEKIGSDYKGPI